MSKKYRGKTNNTINILLVVILLVSVAPVIPVTVIFLAIFYILGIKGKHIIYVALGAIILISIINYNIILNFLVTAKQIFLCNIENVVQRDILSLATVYNRFNIFDWIIITVISLLVTGYFLVRIDKQVKKEKAGVKSLNTQINEINTNTYLQPKDKSGTYIGKNNNKRQIYLQDNAKHVFIAGTTGAGKTVLLSNFIKRAIEQDYGTLVVDGKGDIGQGSILEITTNLCQKYNKKLYVVDMNNPITSSKYNPFTNANETVIKDMLVNMSDWSEEHYKVNVERYLQRLIKLLCMSNNELSFDVIIQNLNITEFESLSMELVKQDKITKKQHLDNIEMCKSSGKIIQDAAARFATIAESNIGQLFDKDGIDITTAIKEKAVILFVLNPLLYPETSHTLGRLILIDSKKAVSNLFNSVNDRKFFIFDEINVYASTTLLDLINKSRSAGVTCFCASQSLADLESAVGESFKHQIIENCNNYFIMRQNSFKSAEECAKLIGTTEKMKMTYQLTDTESTGKGSARKTREFIVHPDDIKSQSTGNCIFVSRDNNLCEKVKVNKPF